MEKNLDRNLGFNRGLTSVKRPDASKAKQQLPDGVENIDHDRHASASCSLTTSSFACAPETMVQRKGGSIQHQQRHRLDLLAGAPKCCKQQDPKDMKFF